MRTTLDVDERVIVAARARARQRGITLGKAVSELALAGLGSDQTPPTPSRHGLVLLPHAPGQVVTDEMVADALDD